MKYPQYPKPNFVMQNELEMPLIPVYAGCTAGEFGCGCIGTCMEVIDHLTIDEVRETNVRVVSPQIRKKYDIYVEGYNATGGRSGASLLGSALGNSFHDAITNYDFGKTKYLLKYDSENSCFRFWGCQLFETLEEAQKSFG